MHREYHRWHSPSLNRPMDLLVVGHAGARVLVFPTSMGKFYEWEDRGMFHNLRDYIDRGWFQFYCVDSVDAESWYARWAHPGGRAWRHVQYENYILHEVMPLMGQKNPTPYLITTGASFGAYHAMNFALRHPEVTNRVLAMSGLFDIARWADHSSDMNVYLNNPSAYMANEHDPWRLSMLKRLDIIIAVGRQDPNIDNNRYFSGLLWQKGVWNALREWDGWAHDWPWWKQMTRLYLHGSK